MLNVSQQGMANQKRIIEYYFELLKSLHSLQMFLKVFFT